MDLSGDGLVECIKEENDLKSLHFEMTSAVFPRRYQLLLPIYLFFKSQSLIASLSIVAAAAICKGSFSQLDASTGDHQ